MNFGGLAGALRGLGGGQMQPQQQSGELFRGPAQSVPQNEGCRLCRERANKPARENLHGALGFFGQALSNVTYIAAAEVTTVTHKPADIDRYSKDHLNPDSIDREMIFIPPVVQDARNGIYRLANDVKSFEYKDFPIKIDEQDTRLLRILSPEDVAKLGLGIPEDVICCNLFSALSVTPKEKYDALSYTWGKQARDIPLLILKENEHQGVTKSDLFTLPATPQLYAALRALRQRGTHCLWIDQLCIDQGNDTEKSKQIDNMDMIYMEAQKTVIWVGEQDENALNLKKFLRRLPPDRDSRTAKDDVDWVEREMNLQREQTSLESDESLRALRGFLNREWFSRAWIFQEAVLSNTVTFQCGTIEFQFDDIARLAAAVFTVENSIAGYARSLMKTTVGYNTLDLIKHAKGKCNCSVSGCRLHTIMKPGYLLEMLLVVLQHLRATQPQDLINAFLGVAFKDDPKDSNKRLKATQDYKEAWIEAAKYIILNKKSLDILVAASGDGGSNIPSWVPDWSHCFKFASPITPPDFFTSFDASGRRNWEGSEIIGNELEVQGRIIGRIAWFSPHQVEKYYYMLPGPQRSARILQLHEHVASIRATLGSVVPTIDGEKLEHVVLRTLLADGAFGHEHHIKESMQYLLDVYDLEDEIEAKDSPSSPDRELLKKIREWGLIAQKKGVFLTEKNALGLAPHASNGGAMIGDEIAILQGSKVPCVIRNKDGRSNRYRVIGQCYLDKMMHGEAWTDSKDGGVVGATSKIILV